MKPDWDSLGAAYADSKTVIIGDVDCTAAGKPLCDKYGVKGYPTIMYFNPPDEDGEEDEVKKPSTKKGDKVMYFKYAGDKMYDSEGAEYIVLADRDILATM